MSRFHLSRRTLLRGLGTALALPTLEVMLPSIARAQSMLPKRFVAFYVPCGIRMNRWTPAATGANYTLSSILQPLGAYNGQASIQADTLVLTGLANRPCRARAVRHRLASGVQPGHYQPV